MNDGGPAFPCAKFIHGPNGNATVMMGGMSLRDYFAAAAMSDVLRSFNWTQKQIEDGAAMCYHLADAMLTEREKESSAAERKESQ